MLYDEIMTHIGEFGSYQAIVFVLLSLSQVPTAWQNMAVTLTGAKMDHWCRIPALENFPHEHQKYIAAPPSEEDPELYSQCTFYDLPYSNYSLEELLAWNRTEMIPGTPELPCQNGWVYDQSEFEATLVSQHDLVCGNSGRVSLTQTIYMCGFLIGCLVFGEMADKIGRKKSLIIANIIQVVFPLLSAFMPVYAAYVVMRFFCGMGSGAAMTTLFVLMSELIGKRHRVMAMMMAKNFYSTAYMLLPMISYAIRNHAKLQLVTALCPTALWLAHVVIPESPRWLIQEARDEEAEQILKKMAEVNGVELPEKLNLAENRGLKEINKLERNPNISDLFRTPGIRCVALNSWFNWFVVSMVYYGLSLGVDLLPGSLFLNTFIAGAIEIPASLILAFTVDRAGRKWTDFGTLVGAGVCCLLCMVFIDDPDRQTAAIVLLMLGKFFSAGTFAIIYLYATELFPTLVRTVGLGSSSMVGRVGSLIQPQINRLETVWTPAPFLVYGVLSILSGGLCLLFPETLGRNLPDTLEEGEEFSKKITFKVKSKKSIKETEAGLNNAGFDENEKQPYSDPTTVRSNGSLKQNPDDKDILATEMYNVVGSPGNIRSIKDNGDIEFSEEMTKL